MPLGYDALELGFNVELETFGRNLAVERTGKQFTGIIDASPPFIPDSLLGEDPREVGVLEFRKDADVEMNHGDTILQEGIATWRAVKRDNNPSDFKVKYWMEKIV